MPRKLYAVISAMLGSTDAQLELLELVPFDSWIPLKDEVVDLWALSDYYGAGGKAWDLSMDVVSDVTFMIPVGKGVTALVKLNRKAVAGVVTGTSAVKLMKSVKRGLGDHFEILSSPTQRLASKMKEAVEFPNPHCFPAGTLVVVADGSSRAIESIREGDEVLADDPTDDSPPSGHPVADVLGGKLS